MRVALVRGPQLNPFEMQTYAPLAGRGFELTAFASRAPFFEPPDGMQVVRLPSPMDAIARAGGLRRRLLEAVAYRRGTANRLEGLERALEGFDVVHAAETFNAYTAQCADAAARNGKPLVVTVWENIPFLPVAPAFARHRERVLREASAFVAVTGRARAALLLEGAPPARVHVVPVGVDLARFAPGATDAEARAALGVPPEAVAFLFAGRLEWEKGILDVVHALRLLDLAGRAGEPAPHLVVAGAGPQERLVRERAQRLGLAQRVHLVGHVPYARIPALYRACDAFVLGSSPTPRWQEQYGMVLVEAMASGLPVVATRSGSIPEVVGEAARLVQPADPTELAEGMAELLDAKTRAEQARRARARAEAEFDRERIADRLARLYRSLA